MSMHLFKFRNYLTISLILSATLISGCISLNPFKKAEPDPDKTATMTEQTEEKKKGEPKPYSEVITEEAKTMDGLLTVHEIRDEYFMEIPDSLFDRKMLLVSRISKGAAGVKNKRETTGYAGTKLGDGVVILSRGEEDKVFLKQIIYRDVSTDSTKNGMFRAVSNSNQPPILAAFDIKAMGPDSASVVINVTEYLKTDSDVLSLGDNAKQGFNLTALQPDKSYINSVHAYPNNVEIKTVKTYKTKLGSFATFELNNSLVLLPKKPMKPRYYDPRVGYFATSYQDYDVDPQGVERTSMIKRWRMKPKEDDMEKYKRGELVEPKDPIVFYIDPATPQKWVPYLIQGVNDWQEAFKQAGFKNAIYAKEVSEKDSTWSLEDARHSAIMYMASPTPNAKGPSISDPRSGEILESHVWWYHNVMELVHNWYMIQAGAVDERARSMEFDQELMGNLIRFVSSHEIGHTLGLQHNFGSSSTVPVEKLRDKEWVEKHGHTPSIMDYARFNYVAQPEDSISQDGIFPRIGEYDKWAIQWGYRRYPEMDREEKETFLNDLVIDSLRGNPKLFFGAQSIFGISDPRSQSEVLGDNPMKANTYGIKNLKLILPQLPEWTAKEGEGYQSLERMYGALIDQYKRYVMHTVWYLSGSYVTPKTVGQEGNVVEPVPEYLQKEAIEFLSTYALSKPEWLFNKKILNEISLPAQDGSLMGYGGEIAELLTSPRIMNYMNSNSQRYGDEETYTLDEMLTYLEKEIWSELETNKPINSYRLELQKTYVKRLINIVTNPDEPYMDEVVVIANIHLKKIKRMIESAIPDASNEFSKVHLETLSEAIDKGLDAMSINVKVEN